MQEVHIPDGWGESVRRIISENRRKVMVLGAADRGKSTYCDYLAGHLAGAGYRVAIVDADVGQKDIGPPACITAGYRRLNQGSAATRPSFFYFVGAVSPVRSLLPMVMGTAQLVGAVRAHFTIINTTGLIHNIGRILKGYKIEAVRPDVIVGIEEKGELESILRAYRNFRSIRLSPSPKAETKSAEQRRSARERAFAGYFRKGSEVVLSLDGIIFQRSLLFTGTPVEDPDFLYCERTPEGVVAVGEKSSGHDRKVALMEPGFEENLLCGAANGKNHCLGLALAQRIDFSARTISLFTPVPAERIRIVQLGSIYLYPDGRQVIR